MRPRAFALAVLLTTASSVSPGCMVLSLARFYDEAAVLVDDRLPGTWANADDNVTVTIERSEWRSYRIDYTHPVEKGQLTAYLFKTGPDGTAYFDLTPVRGQALGSFVVPAHALVRITIAADELTVAPLSFDWAVDGLARRTLPTTLAAFRGERDQLLFGAGPAALQAWLASVPAETPAFGPEARFRKN
jgi:hypothetical protein